MNLHHIHANGITILKRIVKDDVRDMSDFYAVDITGETDEYYMCVGVRLPADGLNSIKTAKLMLKHQIKTPTKMNKNEFEVYNDF